MSGKFEAAFLGTNGSCPYDSGERRKYGTNTLCVAVRAGEETLIFDAGTGICSFGNLDGYQSDHIRLFLSHYHTDHVGGLLFFSEFFNPKKTIDVYAPDDARGIINSFLSPPLHPVGPEAMKAAINFHTVAAGDSFDFSGDVIVRTHKLVHPGGALGTRVEYGGKVFCYCVDVELSVQKDDASLLEFTRGVDLLLLDCAFDDGKVIPGWGHSSWKECAEWAARAQPKQMALFHYGYTMSDADIDEMAKKAQEIFPNTIASADRMRVEM